MKRYSLGGNQGMPCISCGHPRTKIVDGRQGPGGSFRRRRECLACKQRFTTYEKPDLQPLDYQI